MHLAFGILTSRERPASVEQLLATLGPHSRVWIHHDDSQGPRPSPRGRDVRFVRSPVRTAWGEWSLCEAVLATVREALEHPDWEYFQLLSGSCLPLRPVDTFAAHLALDPAEVHMDAVALAADDVALMSHGFRAYAPVGTLRHRILRRLRSWYFGRDPLGEQRAGLSFTIPSPDVGPRPLAPLAKAVMRRARAGALPGLPHPFGSGLDCWVGSTWWGARRHVCEWLVDTVRDAGPLVGHARRMLIPDEVFFQTVTLNAGWRVGPSNHWISEFDGPHPRLITTRGLPAAFASHRWFARKFAPEPADPARTAVLARIGDVSGARRARSAQFG